MPQVRIKKSELPWGHESLQDHQPTTNPSHLRFLVMGITRNLYPPYKSEGSGGAITVEGVMTSYDVVANRSQHDCEIARPWWQVTTRMRSSNFSERIVSVRRFSPERKTKRASNPLLVVFLGRLCRRVRVNLFLVPWTKWGAELLRTLKGWIYHSSSSSLYIWKLLLPVANILGNDRHLVPNI